jgi:hypothetical protein
MFKAVPVPTDAPAMFLAAATDDQLGLAPDSIGLYSQWTAAHKPVELHMYAKGGKEIYHKRLWSWIATSRSNRSVTSRNISDESPTHCLTVP